MGREANVKKVRYCGLCNKVLWVNASGLVEHLNLCIRATGAGLIIPGVEAEDRYGLLRDAGSQRMGTDKKIR